MRVIRKALCTLVPLLCILTATAQSTIINVAIGPTPREVMSDAKLAMERALFDQLSDSIAYWRSATFVFSHRGHLDTIPLLDDEERTLVNYHAFDFRAVLRDIQEGQHFFIDRGREARRRYHARMGGLTGFYGIPSLTLGVRDYWRVRTPMVLDSLRRSSLSATDREFLSLYWMTMINRLNRYYSDPIFPQVELDRRADALLSAEPQYAYAPALKAHIRRKYKPCRVGLGFSVAFGRSVMFGDLGTHYKDGTSAICDVDVDYDRWVFRFLALGLDSKVKTELMVDSIWWREGGKIYNPTFGGAIGRVLWDTRGSRLIPSVGVATSLLTYQQKEETSTSTSSFLQPIADLQFDVKIPDLTKPKDGELSREGGSLWALCFKLGYAARGYGPVIGPQGSMLYFSVGASGFWRPSRLDLD